ncbi:helicase [Streptomyces sp. Tu 6176]|uniref:CRISPR-associated helicase/endonuclease Cas3 n=1 Tax=Streptomyces sp. Tu 6176 TaxID=1470557 RepID=UPI00044A876F|nr:CRISPR-associated helicase/endonuclease Cas3 [Streptomyces sp. Tu 6176]EYT84290.1 helicase [Streptomyces sp. Tu 6176]
MVFDSRLWGKAKGLERPYPLMGHLVDTALIAGVLWDEVLEAGQRERIATALRLEVRDARPVVMLWAGLHDIGKILPAFQDAARDEHPGHCGFLGEPRYTHDRSRDSQVGRVGHEHATAKAVPGLLGGLGYPEDGMTEYQLRCQVGQILGGHHGRYPLGIEEDELELADGGMVELGSGAWTRERREHVALLRELLGNPPVPQVEAVPVASAVVIAGLVIVADWLASQEHVVEERLTAWFNRPEPGTPGAVRAHATEMSALAPGIVADAGLGRAVFRTHDFAEQFPEITDPHPLQRSVEQGLRDKVSGPGILLVTAPTGEGKTEVALHAATVMGDAVGGSGVFFALPTQATANQMYERVRDFALQNLTDSAQVTLTHRDADLHERYQPADGSSGTKGADTPESRVLSHDADHSAASGGDGVSVEASRWLRQRWRGLLAPISVGTIDQALMGVLPLRYNALRHLGLAGKTVVVDEAHSYDAFTHALLLRLLNWLGAMGVPVILLSATLTGETARGLVRAYLTGAGIGSGAGLPTPGYPGWLYADGRTGAVITPSTPVGTVRSRALDITVRRVTHTYDPSVPDGQLSVVFEELEQVARAGGCAAVICTTVGEAQDTYTALRAHLTGIHGPGYTGWDDRASGTGETPGEGTLLRLLHSRFPAYRRAELTAEAESWFGRGDKKETRRPPLPRGAILVATQVIEQSLDLDFDLVLSDLAPMAQLLQRAGRVWRHSATPRPAWAAGPRLVVLASPAQGTTKAPRSWGDVYSDSLLQRTEEPLAARQGTTVAIPGDVQALVDGVYKAEFCSQDPEELLKRDIDRLGDDMARQGLANLVMIPPPAAADLHGLTNSEADADLIATRLGADTVQLLPVYQDADDHRWLDEARTIPLPARGSGRDGRFTRAEVRALLRLVVPYRHGAWRAACTAEHRPPAAWRKEPRLARLVLLPHRVTSQGVRGSSFGDLDLRVDHALGLRAEKG